MSYWVFVGWVTFLCHKERLGRRGWHLPFNLLIRSRVVLFHVCWFWSETVEVWSSPGLVGAGSTPLGVRRSPTRLPGGPLGVHVFKNVPNPCQILTILVFFWYMPFCVQCVTGPAQEGDQCERETTSVTNARFVVLFSVRKNVLGSKNKRARDLTTQ